MTRLAFIVPSLEAGGAERVNLRLIDGLLERGYEVDVVAVRAFGQLLPAVPRGARVVDLQKRRMTAAVGALASYFRDRKPDLAVGVLDSMSAIALVAHRLARSRTKFVVQSHCSPMLARLPARYALGVLMRMLYPATDAVVTVGGEALAVEIAAYSGLPRERIDVILNGVIDEEFFARARMAPDVWPPGAPGQKTVIAIGRLHEVKGFSTLLRTMAILRDRGLSCRLLIVGEGPERASLEREIASLGLHDRVSLLGYVANPLPLIREADLLALASRAEGLPTVLIEALGCGTPVVSTDCEFGPRTILGDGRWGRLVPLGDPLAFADAIESMLGVPRDREALIVRARDFTTERMVAGYVSLFDRVLGN